MSLTDIRYDSYAKTLHFSYIFKVKETTRGITDPVSVKFSSKLPNHVAKLLYRRFVKVYSVSHFETSIPCDPYREPERQGSAFLRRTPIPHSLSTPSQRHVPDNPEIELALEKELHQEANRNFEDCEDSDSNAEDAPCHIDLLLYENAGDIGRDCDTMGMCPCCYKTMPINCFVVYKCGHFSCDSCIRNMEAIQHENRCSMCRHKVEEDYIFVKSS